MRLAWKRHPVKLKFIRLNTITAPVGKKNAAGLRNVVKAGRCNHCGRAFRKDALQVDHISGAGSFTGWDSFEQWMHSLMHVCVADLQYMCKRCHDTKTYAEKHHMEFIDALREKAVIKWLKDTPTPEQHRHLSLMGLPHSNAKERRNSYRSVCIVKE